MLTSAVKSSDTIPPPKLIYGNAPNALKLFREIGAFDEVILWEGLPAWHEGKLRESELATKRTFKIDTQDFYLAPLPLSAAEAAMFSEAVLKHPEYFSPWGGPKFCGGFHADYALEWRNHGTTVAQVSFCFSCGEAEIRVGEKYGRVDQTKVGAAWLRPRFLLHRQERPVHKGTAPKSLMPKFDPVERPPPPRPPLPDIPSPLPR